jgi:hypothetical protein
MVIRDGKVLMHDSTREVFKQARLLASTHIEAPQISVLGRRMVPHGLQDGVLTVPEFCDAYSDLVSRA